MTTAADQEIALLIGRVEGKVDTLVHLSTATSQRIDNLERRLVSVETKTASLAATNTSGKTWASNLIAIGAALAAIAALFKGTQ